MILAKNIHKFYDNNHILKGIDINVNKGEIISLVGASGAGKSLTDAMKGVSRKLG